MMIVDSWVVEYEASETLAGSDFSSPIRISWSGLCSKSNS